MTINEDAIWDAYNLLLLGSDVERIRKLLARTDLFRMSLSVPGDVVECGVFKGSSFMLWIKLLHIFAHGSTKRVVGFDMFDHFPVAAPDDQFPVDAYVKASKFEGIQPEDLYTRVEEAGFSRDRCELVAGDIGETAPDYVNQHVGFRISLLHLDLDLSEPTEAALEALYPRVVKGGVVIFDEYAIASWSESHAVDRFLKDQNIQLSTLPWARTPTAYLIKP
jgi:hypothetical protein